MGGSLGDAVAPLAVGALLTAFSWRDVVVMNVVPGIAASVLLLLLLGRGGGADSGEDRPRRVSRPALHSFAGVRLLLANRTVLMLSLGSVVRAMTAMTLLTFLPVFLANELGYSPASVGCTRFTFQAA